MRAAAMSNRAAILRCCLVGALLLTSAVPARGISVRSSSWPMPVVGNLLVSEGLVRAAAARDAAPSAMARGPSSNNNFPSTATGMAPQERRQLTGSVMTDSNIYTAVAAWLSDSAAAEVTYGHISTWQTSGVTDMSYLFCADTSSSKCNAGAASFNEDISGWDTSNVREMDHMFREASSFNQPIGGWAVDKVEKMNWMFLRASSFNQDLSGWQLNELYGTEGMFAGASAFDQDLGWCVDLEDAFGGTQCESTSCGILPAAALVCGGGPMGNNFYTARAEWLSDATAAEAKYGHMPTHSLSRPAFASSSYWSRQSTSFAAAGPDFSQKSSARPRRISRPWPWMPGARMST